MKLGPILGALSPGLSATGMFGKSAQGVGGGMLTGLSPILAMILQGKKKGGTPVAEGGVQGLPTGPEKGPAVPVMPTRPPISTPPVNPAATKWHGMDRDKLSAMLLQLGGQMGGPFGQRY